MSKRMLVALLLGLGVFGLLSTVVLAGLPEEPLQVLDCSKPPTGFTCPSEKGGSTTYDIIAAPSLLNPVTISDTASESIQDHIFGSFYNSYSLLATGVQGTDPQVASVIEVSKDGTSVTYTIRKGLQYSDGSPVTADDVLYWYYNVVWNPNMPNSATDAFTCPSDGSPFVVTSPAPNQITVSCPAAFRTFTSSAGGTFALSKQMALDLIKAQNIPTQGCIGPGADGVLDSKPGADDTASGPLICPGKSGTLEAKPAGDDVVIDVATAEFLGLGVDIKQLRGLGPFVLTNFNSAAVAQYARNPNFYEADSKGTQLPYLDNLQVTIIPTAGQNLALSDFLNGTSDLLGPRAGDIAPILGQAAKGGFAVNTDIDTKVPAAGNDAFIMPNFDDPDPNLAAAMRNATVRHALFLAINRLAMVQNVLLGQGVPQYNPVSLAGTGHDQFFSGRANTCTDFINAGLATSATCADNKWSVAQGLIIDVTRLPSPNDPNVKEQLSCLTNFAGCVDKAKSLLDSAKVTVGADGVRQIPANFDPVIGNKGGEFVVQIVTNTGNTVSDEEDKIVCSGFNQIGVKCTATTTAFPTLVNQLLQGTFTGFIRIGFAGGSDPASAINVIPCGGALHAWHVSCDPKATSGPTAPTADEQAIEKPWDAGYAAVSVADAQKGFDDFQAQWAQFAPYFEVALGNARFAERIDRISNTGGAVDANEDVKFRCDLAGQQPDCAHAPHQ